MPACVWNRLRAVGAVATILLLSISIAACATQESGTDVPLSGGESPSAVVGESSETPLAADAESGTDSESESGAGQQANDQGAGLGDAPSGSAATATALVEASLPSLDEILGSGGTGPDDIILPVEVAVADDGTYFLADVTGVRKLNPDGSEAMRIGAEEIVSTQGGLALSHDGRLYVTGFGPQVWVFDAADGALLDTIGTEGQQPGQLSKPIDVAVDADGAIYVADASNARVEKFAPSGDHLLSIGGYGQGRGLFTTPRAVAVDGDGYVYVGLGDDYLVQRFAPDGSYVDALGQAHGDENAWRVGGLSVDADGNLYVTQALAGRVQRFTAPEMHLDWELGSPGKDRESFSSPLGVTVDGDRLIVADQGNNRIKVYTLAP